MADRAAGRQAGPPEPSAAPRRLLWLVRHAKAASAAPGGGGDHERPLAPRGRRDAAALGRLLAGDTLGIAPGDLPTVLLCSDAARTAETAERIGSALGLVPDRRRRLYYGHPTDVLSEVRTLPDEATSAMVVGHNPATPELLMSLLAPDDEGQEVVRRHGFPTCAAAAVRITGPRWRDAAPGTGSLETFLTPPYGD